MKLARIALLASLLGLAPAMPALTATAAAPAPSRASIEARASACPGFILMGGKRFATYRRGVTCAGSRTAMRRLYASYGGRGTPRGFRCRSGSRFRKAAGCVAKNDRYRHFGFSRS